MKEITKDNFWNTDLEDIESSFLKKGKKITDLEVHIDDKVPIQGDNVLLDKTINIDEVIKTS